MDSFSWEVEGRRGRGACTIELSFEGERLRIARHGIDWGDGCGPHDEELELAPGDIDSVHWKQRKHLLVVEHTVHGSRSTRTVEEELPVGDDSDRAILLLDRFQRYLCEFGIDGSFEHSDRALVRFVDADGHTIRSPRTGVSSADELLQASTDLKRNLAPEERRRALAAARPYVDGMADMIELPCDKARLKKLQRSQRKNAILSAVGIIAVIFVPYVLADLSDSFILGVVLFILLMLLFLIVVVKRVPQTYSALWDQNVRIGPDRLMFHRWEDEERDDVYFTDVSRTPFCVRLIDSYRVDEAEIVLSGSFWDDYKEPYTTDRTVELRMGTRRSDEFKIARTFSDEDEAALLACLDRLKQK